MQQGATVAVSGRQVEKLEALAARNWATACTSLPCDLGNQARQVGKARGRGRLPKLGRLDILVNNAGLTKDNLFMVMKDEQWDEVIAVNLTSTFMLMRAGARHMMRSKTGYGRIINISSVSGVMGNPGQGNYAASKAGMIGMTKVARPRSRKPGHHCKLHRTRLHQDGHDRSLEREASGRNLPAHSSPSDSARLKISPAAALFLASAEAGYVTGQDTPRQRRHGDGVMRPGWGRLPNAVSQSPAAIRKALAGLGRTVEMSAPVAKA